MGSAHWINRAQTHALPVALRPSNPAELRAKRFARTEKIAVCSGRCRGNFKPMKSAYELAMDRLAKSDPSAGAPVTAEKKTRLAELDQLYKGKLAEREIFIKQQLNQVLVERKADEVAKIREQMASERIRIEEERDAEKEKVRRGK